MPAASRARVVSSGFGTGATQNFYSSVAHALLDATAHRALPVWLCDDAVGATECASERNESACIKHTGELFPRPLPPDTAPATVAAIEEHFRFLGRLMATACRDGFIVPLPLSPDFLHLARGGSLSWAALPRAGATGDVASEYAAVAGRLMALDTALAAGRLSVVEHQRLVEEIADKPFRSRLSLREYLQATSCKFECPITGVPFGGADGSQRDVTVANLPEFVSKLAQYWLADGIAVQADGFRCGVQDVCTRADALLAPFAPAELRTLFCGTRSIEWTTAELASALTPSAGYDRESVPYRLLIEELERMAHDERARFLEFVTACPHLPSVGVTGVAIEVHRAPDGARLPTAQTCANMLRLPPYKDADELRRGLETAFANLQGGGVHETMR